VHVLRTLMRICGQNQPSDAESIEIRVSLTFKYGCRVFLATYTLYSYSFGLHRYLTKKSSHNDRLLSTEETFGFCFALLTLFC